MRGARQRVVIVGGGYAGVRVARNLAWAVQRGVPLEVIQVSSSEHHIDTPLLYEVATAYLHHESKLSSETVQASVCVPLRDIFANLPVSVLTRRATTLNTAQRLIQFSDDTTLTYDVLVVAMGAELATYGIPGVSDFAFSVKTLPEALELRHHIVRQFHMAKKASAEKQAQLLTFVIVGAGAAGVETAAELKGHVNQECQKHGLDQTLPRITLVEASPTILRTIPATLQRFAQARLLSLGIEIKTNQPITAVESDRVLFADGQALLARTIIWTGGLKPHALLSGSGLPALKWGVAVEPTLQVVDEPLVYAVGDAAVLQQSPEPIPATVPVAYGQADVAAANIVRQVMGQPLQPYQYQALGALIAVGGKDAIAVFANNRGLTGYLPWLMKKVVGLRYWNWYLPWWQALHFWWRSIRLQSLNDQ
ncbi:MAG: NAD(P)/FAD-dependent oxidoreductase [Candidatus Andersenbacteria bacterium]